MTEPDTIKINEVEYIRKDSITAAPCWFKDAAIRYRCGRVESDPVHIAVTDHCLDTSCSNTVTHNYGSPECRPERDHRRAKRRSEP